MGPREETKSANKAREPCLLLVPTALPGNERLRYLGGSGELQSDKIIQSSGCTGWYSHGNWGIYFLELP